jgi:hypothetical protein
MTKKKSSKKGSQKKRGHKKPKPTAHKPPAPKPPTIGAKALQLDITTLSPISDADAQLLKRACGIPPPPPPLSPAEALLLAAMKPIAPGKERWPVKTGVDQDAHLVGKLTLPGPREETGIVKTTIAELNTVPRPKDMLDITTLAPAYQDRRAVPVETTIWQIECDLLLLKQEQDGDYHLGLQGDDGNAVMVAEIPNPDAPFVNATVSPWEDDIRAARDEVNTKLSLANQFDMTQPFSTKIKNRRVRITGVGFFDKVHGQSFVAPSNGIELHPVLEIEFL